MLLGSTALDVAIGLVFVYLAVSLVCSALNEVIEGRLKNRSKDLERGIRELLTNTTPAAQGTADAIPEGPARPNQLNIVQTLYDHPLISGLFKNDYSTAKKKGQLPSYIPSRNFALALMDIVGRAAAGGGGTANATAPVPALAPGQLAPAPAAPDNPLTPLREAAMSF